MEDKEVSGTFTAHVPRSLHMALMAAADDEGVSVNSLVQTLLADSLARRFNYGQGKAAEASEHQNSWSNSTRRRLPIDSMPPSELMRGLGPRERQALELAAKGLGNREMSETMGISQQSVKNLLTIAYRKLGVRNRIQALMKVGLVKND